MRILQLIDSLDAGGAERMAVNYANLLSKCIDRSYLCTTRQEGFLKKSLDRGVGYLFLKRQTTFDLKAFWTLRTFIKNENITIVHAHGTSYFLATLLRLSLPNLHLIWHDHYGSSENLNARQYKVLKYCSLYFKAIISVNKTLKYWAEQNLHCNTVFFFKNFYLADIEESPTNVKLQGHPGMRIVCLANLRAQKDHLTLLNAFKTVVEIHAKATLHLLGAFENNTYYKRLDGYIKEQNLSSKVFILGPVTSVIAILEQADIGVLSSKSEGLPLALIEYGVAGLPVVCTDVGDCKFVLNANGIVVPPEDSVALAEALMTLLANPLKSMQLGKAFHNHIMKTYTAEAQQHNLLDIYQSIDNTYE